MLTIYFEGIILRVVASNVPNFTIIQLDFDFSSQITRLIAKDVYQMLTKLDPLILQISEPGWHDVEYQVALIRFAFYWWHDCYCE